MKSLNKQLLQKLQHKSDELSTLKFSYNDNDDDDDDNNNKILGYTQS